MGGRRAVSDFGQVGRDELPTTFLSSCTRLNMIWTSFISSFGPRPPLRPSPCLLSCPRRPELLQALQARRRCLPASPKEER